MSKESTSSVPSTSSVMLPNITADLRREFTPLLQALEGMNSYSSNCYLVELVFALVRFDAFLRAEERTAFVRAFDAVIQNTLSTLRRVVGTRIKLQELKVFLSEVVARCECLEELCEANTISGSGEQSGDADSIIMSASPPTACMSEKQVELQQVLHSSFRRRMAVGLARGSWTAPANLCDLVRSASADCIAHQHQQAVLDGSAPNLETSSHHPQHAAAQQSNRSMGHSASAADVLLADSFGQVPLLPAVSATEDVWRHSFWSLMNGRVPVTDLRLLLALFTNQQHASIGSSLPHQHGQHHHHHHHSSPILNSGGVSGKVKEARAAIALDQLVAEKGSPVQWELWLTIQAVLTVFMDGILNSGYDDADCKALLDHELYLARLSPQDVDTNNMLPSPGAGIYSMAASMDTVDVAFCSAGAVPLPSAEAMTLFHSLYCTSLKNYMSGFDLVVTTAPMLAARAALPAGARASPEAALDRQADAMRQQPLSGGGSFDTVGMAARSFDKFQSDDATNVDVSPTSFVTNSFAFPTDAGLLGEGSPKLVRPVDVILHTFLQAVQSIIGQNDNKEKPVNTGVSGVEDEKSTTNENYSFFREAAVGACADGEDAGNKKNTSFFSPNSTMHGNTYVLRPPTRGGGESCEDSSSHVASPRWSSIPARMLQELRPLLENIEASLDSVKSMEAQLEGEATLLIFRVLSTVLDWLIPAVSLSDPRQWLFYRKWTCDLYRLLVEERLLGRFKAILEQAGASEDTETQQAAAAVEGGAAALPAAATASPVPAPIPSPPPLQQSAPIKMPPKKIKKKVIEKKPRKDGSAPVCVPHAISTSSDSSGLLAVLPSSRRSSKTESDLPSSSAAAALQAKNRIKLGTTAAPSSHTTVDVPAVDTTITAVSEDNDVVECSDSDDPRALVVPGCNVELLLSGKETRNAQSTQKEGRGDTSVSVKKVLSPPPLRSVAHHGSSSDFAVRTAVALIDGDTPITPPRSYVMNRLIAATIRGLGTECVPILRSVFSVSPTAACSEDNAANCGSKQQQEGKWNYDESSTAAHEGDASDEGALCAAGRSSTMYGESLLALVHHHRYRYPVVVNRDDVAQLYLDALSDAELQLSPHDPIRAALVQNTVDFLIHMRQFHRARDVLNDYLAEVNEECIQLPVMKAVALAAGSDGPPGSAPPPTTTSSFSVTSVRRPPSSVAFKPAASAADTGATAATAGGGNSALPLIPLVVPSWSSNDDKSQFLTVVSFLRRTQLFLQDHFQR